MTLLTGWDLVVDVQGYRKLRRYNDSALKMIAHSVQISSWCCSLIEIRIERT